ncbi:unnamed protein product [Amoebophrya sp. A120]|nr:unnamed protein product [Amoebophrya sp. A120]|eukprot:GSA120T00021176001.1
MGLGVVDYSVVLLQHPFLRLVLTHLSSKKRIARSASAHCRKKTTSRLAQLLQHSSSFSRCCNAVRATQKIFPELAPATEEKELLKRLLQQNLKAVEIAELCVEEISVVPGRIEVDGAVASTSTRVASRTSAPAQEETGARQEPHPSLVTFLQDVFTPNLEMAERRRGAGGESESAAEDKALEVAEDSGKLKFATRAAAKTYHASTSQWFFRRRPGCTRDEDTTIGGRGGAGSSSDRSTSSAEAGGTDKNTSSSPTPTSTRTPCSTTTSSQHGGTTTPSTNASSVEITDDTEQETLARLNEQVRALPQCRHVFHKECLFRHLKHHVTTKGYKQLKCPICRARTNVAQKFRTVDEDGNEVGVGEEARRRAVGQEDAASRPAIQIPSRGGPENSNSNALPTIETSPVDWQEQLTTAGTATARPASSPTYVSRSDRASSAARGPSGSASNSDGSSLLELTASQAAERMGGGRSGGGQGGIQAGGTQARPAGESRVAGDESRGRSPAEADDLTPPPQQHEMAPTSPERPPSQHSLPHYLSSSPQYWTAPRNPTPRDCCFLDWFLDEFCCMRYFQLICSDTESMCGFDPHARR